MEKTIITIGRQYGSGGRQIANMISEKTGIPVYDKSLLTEAAQKSGYSSDLFKKRDEKRHIFGLSRLFSTQMFNAPNYLDDSCMFQMQSEAIRQIAEKGSCIIVGRCANYVLRDMDTTDIFITSPIQTRIDRVTGRLNVDRDTARKIIEKKEKDRAEYYRTYTLGKWGDIANYDLCVDSSVLGLEATADLIISFFTKKREKNER